MVTLTKINKQAVLAILAFNLEKPEVLLVLLEPLGLWTLHLWLPPRNSTQSALLQHITKSDDSEKIKISSLV